MNPHPTPADRVASILQNLGEAYLARGQYAEAAEKFAQLLQAGNAAPAVPRNLALALLGLQQANEQAQRLYRHALQLFPHDRELLLRICRVLLARESREAFALQIYRQVLFLNPPAGSEMLHAIARHFLKQEQWQPAFETLKRAALQENGEAPQTLAQIIPLGWRLGKYAEVRSVLEYLSGRNEKGPAIRRWLGLDSAYAIHRDGAGHAAAARNWQTIVLALSHYDKVEYLPALREFSVLRLALALVQQAQNARPDASAESPVEVSLAHELAGRLLLPPCNKTSAPNPQAQPQILALKIANLEQLAAHAGKSVAHALADKFIDFSAKYLMKAVNAGCYRLRDGLLAFADAPKLLAIAAVDLLHKIERYNATAKPGTQIWVQTAVHAQSESEDKPEPAAWRMLSEALHLVEIKTAAVAGQHRNSLIFARAIYENQIGREILPAKYAGPQRAEAPFFHAEIYEAIWRNPVEYVQEQTPYVLGKFLVTAKLRGSRAAGTYAARDRELERRVILKSLSPHHSYRLMQEPALRERVLSALRQIGRLGVPGVAMIYDMGFQEEIFFFVRECLEGKSLEQVLQSGRRLSMPEGLALGLRVCRILQATHRAGVWHGNLKPGNIWLAPSGEVKITDFFVPLFVGDPDQDNLLDPASWQYSAPERRHGALPHAAGDVFSLGVILYELMSGELPARAEEFSTAAPFSDASSSSKNPPLPPPVVEIFQRACAVEMESRFQSLLEFEQALRRLAELLQEDRESSFEEITRLAQARRLLEKGR